MNNNILHDIEKVTSDSGKTVQETGFDAFGNKYAIAGTELCPVGYRGEYHDAESGLIYLHNRYYDPEIGRFITEDPVKDGSNWYVYCGNNPIMLVDPNGLDPWQNFDSPDEAAADFGMYIGQKSINQNEEYASCIYKDVGMYGKTYYYYDTPRNELKTHEKRQNSFYISWNKSPYAIVHTHGAYDVNTSNTKDFFSTPDNVLSGNKSMSDTGESDRLGINYYVVTPVGNLRKYTANSGEPKGELINSNMPVDDRFEMHEKMKNTFLWRLLEINFPKGSPQDYVDARLNNPDSLADTISALGDYR